MYAINQTILAGWARADITLAKPVALMGQFYDRFSTSIKDPITATVLAIGSKKDVSLLISCDIGSINRDIRDLLRRKIQNLIPAFDTNRVMISATHIHTGPYISRKSNIIGNLSFRWPEHNEDIITPEEYAEFFTDRISQAAYEAIKDMKHSGVSAKLAYAVAGHNRRTTYDDGSAKMYGNTDTVSYTGPEGPEDHGIELLYVFDDSNELSGVVINAAVPAQVLENRNFITADLWGAVRRHIDKKFGKNLHVLALCAAAGDQAPRDIIRRARNTYEPSSEEWMDEIAQRIVFAVMSKYEEAKDSIEKETVFIHEVKELMLPIRKIELSDYQRHKNTVDMLIKKYDLENCYLDKRKISSAELETLYISESIVAIYEKRQQDPLYSMYSHFIRIGDIAFTSNPFELFTEYGLIIKARSRAKQTFIAQLTDDTAGYLPTMKAQKGSGYSAFAASGIVGPEGGRLLVEYCVKHINDLWK